MRIFQKAKRFLSGIIKKGTMKKRSSLVQSADKNQKTYRPFQKAVQALMLTICVVFFAVGGIWNVAQYLSGNPLLEEAIAYTEAMSKAEPMQTMQPMDLENMGNLVAAEKTKEEVPEEPEEKTENTEDAASQEADEVMAVAYQVNQQMAEADAAEAVGGLHAILKGNVPQGDQGQSYEEQIAAFRIDKERSWAQKLEYLQALASNPESSTTLRTTAENQLMQGNAQRYLEQQLELLIKAKDFSDCLVVINEKQINVIVEEKEAKEGYLKLADIILRNSDFTQEQIVILPL